MIKQNFKSFTLKITLLGLILLTLLSVIACGPKSKEFNSPAGLKITLTTKFYEKEIVGQTLYLESQNAIFCALKESFTDLSVLNITSENSIEDYAEVVKNTNHLSAELKTDENNLTYMDYEKTVTGRNFFYRAYFFKGTDAFWLCQFACLETNKDSETSNFVEWANTIVVD